MFMQGDRVRYVGSKLNADVRKSFGEVCSRVLNQKNVYVVDFGDDSYIMPESSLAPYVATAKELEQAAKSEAMVTKRRRASEDEE